MNNTLGRINYVNQAYIKDLFLKNGFGCPSVEDMTRFLKSMGNTVLTADISSTPKIDIFYKTKLVELSSGSA